ncbi:hypothetical protein HYV82_02275 [Candidatus Woesearchaeota archaeon]|nr:hypothetical protein [Candidatus Woesearchaeota archaeon]
MDIEKQLKCKHKQSPAKEIIVLKGRTAIMEVMRCEKCGEVSAPVSEVAKARKTLNPAPIERLKELFGLYNKDHSEASIFRGRIL